MKMIYKFIPSVIFHGSFFLFFPILIFSQAQYNEILHCGGSEVISILINDNDSDGIDDGLEQLLLEKFMPVFIRFDDDDCPGPSPSGATGNDTNLVVCRIYALPPQYTTGNNLQLLSPEPQEIAAEKNLKTGLVWYNATIIAHCALLYGKDCGLTAHTADVEGFTFTLQYKGNLPGGWRFDTTMNNWIGKVIQTVSHAGTLCEKIETMPRLNADFPNGYDTIFASPDKHGNYLTISKCNSGILCDPSCNGTKIVKTVKIVNSGEENFPLVTDLGNYYSEYTGENPWGSSKFLESIGGSAGTIKDKLLKELTSDFLQGKPLDSCYKICNLYDSCFSCGNTIYNNCVFSCDTIQSDSFGALIPIYVCTNLSGNEIVESSVIRIFPNPSSGNLHISELDIPVFPEISLTDIRGKDVSSFIFQSNNTELNLQNLGEGIYFLKIRKGQQLIIKKVIVF